MTHFVLVRHGETDKELQNKTSDGSDHPLNRVGRAQARHIALLLKETPLNAIISSDLRRSQETANIIATGINIAAAIDTRLGRAQSNLKSLSAIRERIIEAIKDIAHHYGDDHVVLVADGLTLALVKSFILNHPLEDIDALVPQLATIENYKLAWQLSA